MEISKILTADILDIVFEGKNKDYGAYELRKSYAGRMRMSIAVTSSVVLLCVAGFLFAGDGKMNSDSIINIPYTTLTEVIAPPVEPPLVPPPPVKPPEVKQRRHFNIVIVKDHNVPPDQEVPVHDDLKDAKIGLVNAEGPKFDDIPPPAKESIGKGIIEPPKKPNEDSVFLTVSIESSYPGGTEAWHRFLIKSLSNNYPQEAVEQGIQGKVIVMFIVDKQGNVSDVHAIEGPKELHEIAVKTIKKSGKWQPAQQNGKIVNSYKRQPISFTLSDQ